MQCIGCLVVIPIMCMIVNMQSTKLVAVVTDMDIVTDVSHGWKFND